MQSINEIQDEIVEEFAIFDDPLDQYEYIIDIGKQLPAIEERYKVDENLVHGCQSKVWLYPHIENGLLHYEADSNTVITKGIIALLIRLLSRQEPDEIINAELYCIDKINLRTHLSSQRANGLASMIKQMKLYALAFKAKNAVN